ncbi:MAG: transposase [Fimbriimonadaceae bacterium]|nr:transposase [Fimbriimonadaceae bacterium]
MTTRWACQITGISTAALYRELAPDRDASLRGRLRSVWRPNMGYRMAHALVRQEFAPLNVKRVHRVWKVLSNLFENRAAPKFLRSDNGSEFISRSPAVFLSQAGTESRFIKPGSPWQNAKIERFNARLRAELLNAEVFSNLADAQLKLTLWRRFYNEERPHSSLGYLAPASYAQTFQETTMPEKPPHL